jgi:leader peptidase (prepilin peptidase)/N-methyltransferase
MGDVKLLAALGLFLGPYSLMTLFVAALAGGVYALATWRKGGAQRKFAFGPFLAASGVLITLFGPILWAMYRLATGA